MEPILKNEIRIDVVYRIIKSNWKKYFAVGFVAVLVKFYGFNASKTNMGKYYSYLLFFFVAYINIVYLVIGTPDCIHFLRNSGFQHTMAILSAAIIIVWSAFGNKKLIEDK